MTSPTLPGARLLVVALVALNLRPFLTATGPLASQIRTATGLSLPGLSLLTLLPMLLMGLLAFSGPWLDVTFGARRVVLAALGLIAIGSLLRLLGGNGEVLLATAVLLGSGAALIQAVFPGVIKRLFPERIAAVTGLYSACLVGGGAVGAQAAPILAALTQHWQAGLAWLAAPALLAMAAVYRGLAPRQREPAARISVGQLLRWPRTWLLIACFGLVNGGYSSAVAWLAPALQAAGTEQSTSGGLLALMALCQAAAALILPICAGRRLDRRPWLLLALALQLAGYLGLVALPGTLPALWAALLGVGLGGSFALMLLVALDQFPAPGTANALAALMQGGGFILAALPPFAVAVLHDLSGSFAAGWLLHLGAAGLVALLSLRLTPPAPAAPVPA